MNIGVILLRIVHIFAGVFWVGGGIFMFAYIEPAVKATAPAGQKFMQYLTVQPLRPKLKSRVGRNKIDTKLK